MSLNVLPVSVPLNVPMPKCVTVQGDSLEPETCRPFCCSSAKWHTGGLKFPMCCESSSREA